jgi:hypothetical protein
MKSLILTLASCALIALAVAGVMFLIVYALGPAAMFVLGVPACFLLVALGAALLSDVLYDGRG